jgi:hypothetical protein
MWSAALAGRCPNWCAKDHTTEQRDVALYHASTTASLTISGSGGSGSSVCVEVETVQHIPDDPRERAWPLTVEVALHEGNRYRLIGLTPEEALQLAGMLTRAAGRRRGPEES